MGHFSICFVHHCANILCSIRRNKVRKAVYDTWKGNSVPLFKTDSAERQKLEELAATLIPTAKQNILENVQ